MKKKSVLRSSFDSYYRTACLLCMHPTPMPAPGLSFASLRASLHEMNADGNGESVLVQVCQERGCLLASILQLNKIM